MYLYYDENFHLQEMINDRNLHQGDTANYIYAYFAKYPDFDTTVNQPYYTDDSGIKHYASRLQLTLAVTSTAGQISYVQLDPLTTASQSAVPYDRHRDLRFFAYSTQYPFFVFPISSSTDGTYASTVLSIAGRYDGTPILAETWTPTAGTVRNVSIVCDVASFYVQDSTLQAQSYITKAQYAYLVSLYEALAQGGTQLNWDADSFTLALEGATGAVLSSVNLNYATQSWVNGVLASYATTSAMQSYVSGQLASYTTTANLTTLLASYATTSAMNTALSSYMPLSGGTFTGAVVFGNGATFNSTLTVSNTGGSFNCLGTATFAGATSFGQTPTVNGSPVVTSATFPTQLAGNGANIVSAIGTSYVQNATHATTADGTSTIGLKVDLTTASGSSSSVPIGSAVLYDGFFSLTSSATDTVTGEIAICNSTTTTTVTADLALTQQTVYHLYVCNSKSGRLYYRLEKVAVINGVTGLAKSTTVTVLLCGSGSTSSVTNLMTVTATGGTLYTYGSFTLATAS